MVFRHRSQISDSQEKSTIQLCVAVIVVMLVLSLTGPHTAAPEVAWLVALYLGYLYAVAFKYPASPLLRLSRPLIVATGLGVTLGVIWGAYGHSFGSKGYKATITAPWWPVKNDYGHYYPYTRSETIGSMVWLMPQAHVSVRADSDVFGLKFAAHPANSQAPSGQRLDIYLNGDFLERLHFFNGGNRKQVYYFPGLEGTTMRLKFVSNKSFRPSDFNGRDDRLLAVARTPIKFYANVPSMGIGFYEGASQTLTAPPLPLPDGLTVKWTGMRASIPLSRRIYREGTIWVACTHPDVSEKPLKLDLYINDSLLLEKELTDHYWQKIPIAGDRRLQVDDIITFQVDRTWNPRLTGVSDTSLDLGLAVALPQKKSRPSTARR
jgi:hypothetical protein